MSLAAVTAAVNIPPAISLIYDSLKNIFNAGVNAVDASKNSLTAYTKTGRISSRVYIDASVAPDPVITDILKTVHTQYCAFILTALQMNQFVSAGVSVQDLLRVVATEDYKPHKNISSSFGVDSDRLTIDIDRGKFTSGNQPDRGKVTTSPSGPVMPLPVKSKTSGSTGEIVSFAGDNHIPAGKVIEVTLTNPANPDHKVTINLLVQLAPYIVPEELAVQFIVKDSMPSFKQRIIQWKTGEISFFKDLLLGSDIINHREKMLKLDPSGVFADMMQKQQSGRGKTLGNINKSKDNRARNISNSVLIFNQDTVTRAKAESGIDLTNYYTRQEYFGTTFAMIIVVVDIIYNQVTFYYNGIEDVGTFSFDQMRVGSKGNSMDLVSVMNALNQGKSPKF